MNRRLLNTRILLVFIFYILFKITPAYADTVETKLSSDKISMGETFMLSFTLQSGANGNRPDFSALSNDFRILSTNYGSALNIINGVTSSQTFWRLTVTPKHPGTLIIPPIKFGDDMSEQRQLIVEQAVNQPTSIKGDSPAFLQAEISTNSPYLQSQFIYTVKLFYRNRLDNPRIEIPPIKDVTFFQLGDGRQYSANIKGEEFNVVEKNFALFPQKSGPISIPPSQFYAITYDLPDNMMNSPFSIGMPREINLQTKAFTLNVKSIPANIQGTSWMPAKNVALTEEWSAKPDQWETGNPVTRTIHIEADGLRADQIPDIVINKIAGVNLYVDPPKRANRTQANSIIGTLEQKVTYIPNTSFAFVIPEIKLAWWNIDTNSNAVASLSAQPIHIKTIPGNGMITPANSIPITSNLPVKPITPTPPKLATSSYSFYQSPWFWIAVLLLLLWVSTLWLFFRKKSTDTKRESNVITESNPTPDFKEACMQGDAALAQQYLLSWAKQKWPDNPVTLANLKRLVNDDEFNSAIEDLERGIYAKQSTPWNGNDLFIAFQKIKKSRFKSKPHSAHKDPLPPLNP